MDILIAPPPRQVLVIATDWKRRKLGFALACRARTEDAVHLLTQGSADGVTLSEMEFRHSVEDSDAVWTRLHPEARIVHLDCPEGVEPQAWAETEARRRVTSNGS